MTNSKPQDTTQTKTQSYGLLRQRGDQATVLDFSPERGDGSGSDERGDVVQPSTRRDAATTDVTAGGPTLRRTAALQTHATQHGRQRQMCIRDRWVNPRLPGIGHTHAIYYK